MIDFEKKEGYGKMVVIMEFSTLKYRKVRYLLTSICQSMVQHPCQQVNDRLQSNKLNYRMFYKRCSNIISSLHDFCCALFLWKFGDRGLVEKVLRPDLHIKKPLMYRKPFSFFSLYLHQYIHQFSKNPSTSLIGPHLSIDPACQ